MDMISLAETIGLEKEEYVELLELFLETTASDISKLERAIEEGDHRKIFESSHSIKGASADLRLMEINELARTLEMNGRENRLDGSGEILIRIRRKLDEIRNTLKG